MMPAIEIKIVKPRPVAAAKGQVDYEERDFREWAVYAIRHQGWRQHCEVGETRFGPNVESVVIIAAPDGRVAVWYGRTTLLRHTENRPRRGRKDDTANPLDGAIAALQPYGDVGRAAAAYWDKKRTRGGDRDVSQLAAAACRVLHADAYGYSSSLRDRLLAEFTLLEGDRPPTPHLLRATDNELLAASALLAARENNGARSLLARKGAVGA
jgi:hypothetical protein